MERERKHLNRADAKSLALYQAIRHKLENDPDRVSRFRESLAWVRKFKPSMPEVPYLSEWEQRLLAAIDSESDARDLLDWMVSTDDHAITMRSCSPFSQVLTTRERTETLIQFADGWNTVGCGKSLETEGDHRAG